MINCQYVHQNMVNIKPAKIFSKTKYNIDKEPINRLEINK